jgi:hypothetical protein
MTSPQPPADRRQNGPSMITVCCETTELIVEQCAHCRGIPDPPPRALGHPFAAAHSGRCCDCDTPFAAGTRIRSAGDDGYAGPCCQEDQ